MDNFWRGIEKWAASIDLVEILVVVAIGILLYKLSGIFVEWLINLIAKRGKRAEKNQNERKKRLKTLTGLFTIVLKIVIVLTVIFTILGNLKINMTFLFGATGIVGVALGFGAQNVIKDALAGFFIILENQYRVGDFIDISGAGIPTGENGGTVEKLSIRTTTLRDRNGNVHFIPNGAIVQVVNKTLGFSKVHFTFAVASGTDTEKIINLINKMGREMAKEKGWKEKIVDPPHFSEIGKIGKDGFNITVSGATEPADQWDVSSEFRRRLLIKLADAEVEIVETI